MKMPRFTYHRPDTVAEAVALLAEHDDAKVLAGGQSLLPMMALRLAQPQHVIDIGRLSDLATITARDGGVAIGALVRHSAAEDSELIAGAAPLVCAAMPLIGHRAIRNRGTVVGSLAHADAAAELPAVTRAVDATFVARSVRGDRLIPAADFFEGYLSTALAPDELLTEVRLPPWPATAGGSVMELSRRYGDYALVGLAAMVDVGTDGTIASAALSFFGAGTVPVRATAAELSLRGKAPTADAFAEAAAIVAEHLDPPDDNHASRAYRIHLAAVLTRRALAQAAADVGALA